MGTSVPRRRGALCSGALRILTGGQDFQDEQERKGMEIF
jgi:hypothetical protein